MKNYAAQLMEEAVEQARPQIEADAVEEARPLIVADTLRSAVRDVLDDHFGFHPEAVARLGEIDDVTELRALLRRVSVARSLADTGLIP